jgi:hypothetical protein
VSMHSPASWLGVIACLASAARLRPHHLTCCRAELRLSAFCRYKKNVMMVRGRFRPFTLLHNDMLQGAAAQFFCEPEGDVSVDNVRTLAHCVSLFAG